MNYLIQGVFFQEHSWLDIGFDITGSVPVVKSGLIRTMFAGFIHPQSADFPGVLVGLTQDHYGYATLSRVTISDTKFAFTKRYDKYRELESADFNIVYTFQLNDGISWVGNYVGKRVGNGVSRCLVTLVDDSFFDPRTLAKLLGRDIPYESPAKR